MWTASWVPVCHWTGGERPATKPSSSVSSYVEANVGVRARISSMARSSTLVDGDCRMHTAASTLSSADLACTPLEGVQHVAMLRVLTTPFVASSLQLFTSLCRTRRQACWGSKRPCWCVAVGGQVDQ